MSNQYKVGMISLGCNKNRVDSEIALGILRDHGYAFTGDPAEADVLMVNTCGFIGPAKEESIEAILEMAEYKKNGRCKVLVVTGCLAQRYEQDLMTDMPEIDILMGVNQYDRLGDEVDRFLRDGNDRRSFCQDTNRYFEHSRVLTTPAYTAYIRTGEGCSNRCTFCAIPLIRGSYRSRSEEAILNEIRDLAAQGVREHILVAQDTTRYGTDWDKQSHLPELLEKAAAIEGVEWLRVLYCYPDETDQRLLDTIANTPNICKYLDLPIQHVNDRILRRMNRRGTSADIRRAVKLARERDLTLRTSIIVGFPGETEEEFRELLEFVEEAQFDRLGAFTYSPEEGTPAANFPDQIDEEVKQERLDRLMTLQAKISEARCARRVGTVERVLVTDRNEQGMLLGRSMREAPEEDGEIVFKAIRPLPKPGDFVNVKITESDTYDLTGVMVP